MGTILIGVGFLAILVLLFLNFCLRNDLSKSQEELQKKQAANDLIFKALNGEGLQEEKKLQNVSIRV
ncbi:MAG: hypothetical protein V4501_08235 [Pseudomonadota bacterium]